MSGARLIMRNRPQGTVIADVLGRELFRLSCDEIRRLRLRLIGGSDVIFVGDVFSILACNDERICIEGDLSNMHRVGTGWSDGELVVEGNVGDGFASSVSGGSVSLIGNAGSGVAEQMCGGTLKIVGNVGDDLGCPSAGKISGIRGGRVVIHGDVGRSTGYRMRRGTILILGNCAGDLGCQMVAGTILVAGQVVGHIGRGMRRGTLVVGESAQISPIRFAHSQISTPGIASLLAADLCSDASDLKMALKSPIHRFLGDLTAGGMGEVWQLRG